MKDERCLLESNMPSEKFNIWLKKYGHLMFTDGKKEINDC